MWYNILRQNVGVWRRLVARYLGVVEAVGSSPATPTIENRSKPSKARNTAVFYFGSAHSPSRKFATVVILFGRASDLPSEIPDFVGFLRSS